ncbi:MAG TPA: hypothetical protein VKB20_11785 [Steroidobacteraceae bacterium]|nr:hypothetical protein [Steroidobacteraceae bacterium]
MESNEEREDTKGPARSLEIARRGIYTAQDFCNVMSALMVDLLEGRVTDRVGNATVNAGGKMLKAAELQQKYGVVNGPNRKELKLADRALLCQLGETPAAPTVTDPKDRGH